MKKSPLLLILSGAILTDWFIPFLVALGSLCNLALAEQTGPSTQSLSQLSDTQTPAAALPKAEKSIVEEIPGLQKYVYSEPESHFSFGFGVSPLSIVKNRIGFAVNIFQVHWISPTWDWELFSASFGNTISDSTGTNVRTYTFRTVPKFRITNSLSAGPLLGLEFVNFPDVDTKIFKNSLFSPDYTAFSSVGVIYGVGVSESFRAGKDTQFKINQLAYKQNYSTTGTYNGWQYYFARSDLNADTTPIAPGWVFLFELSFIY